AEERCLTATVRTEQAKNFARSDAKRDIVEREAIAIAMSQTFSRERRRKMVVGLHGRDHSGNSRWGENPVEPRMSSPAPSPSLPGLDGVSTHRTVAVTTNCVCRRREP